MAESNNTTFQGIDISKLINPPIHEHESFNEIGISQERIWEAAAALRGMGAMMQAEIGGGHQMKLATIGDAGAIFRFFGDFLRGEAEEIIHHRDEIVNVLSRKGGHHD